MHTVTQTDWRRAQAFYVNRLAAYFDLPPTDAMLEDANRELQKVNAYMQYRETALVWKIPVKIARQTHFSFDVVPVLESTHIQIVEG